MEYLKYPKNIKDLAFEIKRLVDDYWARACSEKDLKEAIMYYGLHEGKKLFKANELNPTIRLIIGAKRTEIVERMLEGLQTRII